MTIEDNTNTPTQSAESAAFEAMTAKRANEPDAMAENEKQLAALSDSAGRGYQAEHIRGVVAATMSQLSANATSATRENATRWQAWALSLADGLDGLATKTTGVAA
jgi:hypothetical protein